MSAKARPEKADRKQYSISAKLDEQAKRLLAEMASERGVTQSQIVLEGLSGNPQNATPISGAARRIVMLCHELRDHLRSGDSAATMATELNTCRDQLVSSLPELFELVRRERSP